MRSSITETRRIVLRAMAIILAPALSACAPESGSADANQVLDFEALSATLLARMDLQPGERVLLVGEGGSRWDAIVPLLREGGRRHSPDGLPPSRIGWRLLRAERITLASSWQSLSACPQRATEDIETGECHGSSSGGWSGCLPSTNSPSFLALS